MKNKCLYCYESINDDLDFHPKCSGIFFGTSTAPKIEYSFNQMNELAKDFVEKSISVPGVQPKLSMSIVKDTRKKHNSRLTILGALDGQFIFKPTSEIFNQVSENESLTMKIAENFGINVVPSSLIRLASGELSYITKRIDRKANGDKIHMIDMYQITEAFDKYKSSMEKIGKALTKFSSNPLLDKIFFFELTLFSFLTGNNDMHLKNFSMIESSSGWLLAPAYDLLNVSLILPEDMEELALTLEGKKSKFRKEHFENFAKGLGLTEKQISGVFVRLKKNQEKAGLWIEKSFLSTEQKIAYKEILNDRYYRLFP